MSTPVQAIATGTFTSDGVSQRLSIPSDVDVIETLNLTTFAAGAGVISTKWKKGMTNASAYVDTVAAGVITPTVIVAAGFTPLDTSVDTLGAANTTITAVSNANPAGVTLTSTAGLAEGDVVRIYNTSGMLQIAGLDFSIDNLVLNTSFDLSYLDASAFAAAGTAGTIRRVPFDPMYYPRKRTITGITAAASAVITLSVTHGFTVGQRVRLRVPTAFGMSEMNNLLGTIEAIDTANNTITVDVDSSAFTAFAYPTSAVAGAGVSFPEVIPVGEDAASPYEALLDDATDNRGVRGMVLGSGVVGTAADVIRWTAYKGVEV